MSSITSERELDLPFDVIELIVDNLLPPAHTLCSTFQSQRDLRSCCLVSKAWIASCRSRLFKEVEIGPCLPNQSRRLAQNIRNQPSIGALISKIVYMQPSTPLQNDTETDMISGCSPFLTLPNIRSLRVEVRRWWLIVRGDGCEENGLPLVGWLSLLKHYTSSGQLARFSMSGRIQLPLMDIVSLPYLQELSLAGCDVVDSPMSAQSTWEPSGSLTSFTAVKLIGNFRVWMLFSAICHQLEHLSLSVEENTEESVDAYFQSNPRVSFPRVMSLELNRATFDKYVGKHIQEMFPSLMRLKIILSPGHPPDHTTLYLPPISGLQSFSLIDNSEQKKKVQDWNAIRNLLIGSRQSLTHLHFDFTLLPHLACQFLENLSEAFGTIKQRNVLQTLEIILDNDSTSLAESLSCITGWRVLANTLTVEKDFPSLRRVFVEFSVGCEDVYADLALKAEVKKTVLLEPLESLTACPHVNSELLVAVEYY